MPLKLDNIDYDNLFNDDACPPEILITPAGKSKDPQSEKRAKWNQLQEMARLSVANSERRYKMDLNKGGTRFDETSQLSDRRFDDELYRSELCTKETRDEKDRNSRVVNAFQENLSQCISRKLVSSRGQFKPLFSSTPRQSHCLDTRVIDRMKNITSNGDKKVDSSATPCSRNFFTNKRKRLSPLKQPVTKSTPGLPSYYNRSDEDNDNDEEPRFSKPDVEKPSDCMTNGKVYYPSKDDWDPIEVSYTDMACLAPKAWMSSRVMNFYIRYLEHITSSSENIISSFHFFNTYFYNKLEKLNYSVKDSFLNFRKWWKHVNIFEKAYLFLPVHQDGHWSLAIICIPNKKDELGPVALHMDSFGLHDSGSIFDNIRSFVKEEWSYLRNSKDTLDVPITNEVWENLDLRITEKRIQVPRQKNVYDCGIFVLFYIERFIKEAPERLTEKDLSMLNKQWFCPKEASNLRRTINNLLVGEFKKAKEKELATLSPKC